MPRDGQTNPVDTTIALAKAARMGGAALVEGVEVTGFMLSGSTVTGVKTDKGLISCEVVVLCAGLWSRHIGSMAGVNVPIYAAEHMYVTTKEMEIGRTSCRERVFQ